MMKKNGLAGGRDDDGVNPLSDEMLVIGRVETLNEEDLCFWHED